MSADIPSELFQHLDESELKTLMEHVARKSTQKVFKAHFDAGQSGWDPNDPEYADDKGNKPLFVKDGDALEAMTSYSHPYKKVSVKQVGDETIVSVSLSRMKDGVDVYAIAQYKHKMPVSVNLPGDDVMIEPILEDELIDLMKSKGLI